MSQTRIWIFIETALFFTGILVFTYFISGVNQSTIIAGCGIALSAILLARQMTNIRQVKTVLGFLRWKSEYFMFVGIAMLAGALLGMVYRDYLDVQVIPIHLSTFVFVAMAVGATEELVFRGYLQTRLAQKNTYLAIVLASLAHSVYKMMIFISFKAGLEVNVLRLVILTFLVGIIFGYFKELTKSTWIAIGAHVIFDFVVYGDQLISPWWVW